MNQIVLLQLISMAKTFWNNCKKETIDEMIIFFFNFSYISKTQTFYFIPSMEKLTIVKHV